MLTLDKLIQPLFVIEGRNVRQSIPGFAVVYRYSIDRLVLEAKRCYLAGIKSVLLFGISQDHCKDPLGRSAYEETPLVARAVQALKKALPQLEVMTDVCLCAYTTHGHCGVLKGQGQSPIDKVKSRRALAAMAVAHAHAGADWVAPSAMCEGQVKAIRQALDKSGFSKTRIMGYSAKFASSFYGPFRQAAKSAPAFGDRQGYQLDPSDADKALARLAQDVIQGADMVMVKPALCYLDILYRATKRVAVPVAAFNVSGEYAMFAGLKAQQRRSMVAEVLTGIMRAGASRIITYHAFDMAKYLRAL